MQHDENQKSASIAFRDLRSSKTETSFVKPRVPKRVGFGFFFLVQRMNWLR